MSADVINNLLLESDWKHRFLKILFPVRVKDLSIEEAYTLKDKNLPESIFRFRKIDDNEKFFEREIQNLQNNEIWLSSPSAYNDPYDCHYYVDNISCNKGQFIELFVGEVGVNFIKQFLDDREIHNLQDMIAGKSNHINLKVLDMYNKFNKLLVDFSKINDPTDIMNNLIHNQFIVCSFSEINTSILMWSHYAGNHQGFCVEYDLKSIQSNFIPRLIFPVIYSDEIFNATEYHKYALLSIKNRELPPFNNLHHIKGAMYKATCWKYEKEWRFIYPYNDVLEKNNFKIGLPQAIYFGAKTKQSHIDQIKEIYLQTTVKFYQMQMQKDQYKLLAIEI